MLLVSRGFRIGVVILEEFLDVLDFVIIGINEISVGYRSVDKLIESSVLNVLLDVFHLEIHHLCV